MTSKRIHSVNCVLPNISYWMIVCCKFWWFINNWGDCPQFYRFHLPCVTQSYIYAVV